MTDTETRLVELPPPSAADVLLLGTLGRSLRAFAVTQIRCYGPARDYVERKMREGKTEREAIRCLKRQLVRVVFTTLRSDRMTSTETAPVLQPAAA